jgi:hypothetical protein
VLVWKPESNTICSGIFAQSGTEVADMKELVETMAKALVDYPDQVELTEIGGGETIVIELSKKTTTDGIVLWLPY